MNHKYKPTNNKELKKLVNEVDNLALIDTSLITNMSYLFNCSTRISFKGLETWNTHNVKDMSSMFTNTNFNEDISEWDTANVKDMGGMFAFTPFNYDISNWNISKVENARRMFLRAKFHQDLAVLAKQNLLFSNKRYLGFGE